MSKFTPAHYATSQHANRLLPSPPLLLMYLPRLRIGRPKVSCIFILRGFRGLHREVYYQRWPLQSTNKAAGRMSVAKRRRSHSPLEMPTSLAVGQKQERHRLATSFLPISATPEQTNQPTDIRSSAWLVSSMANFYRWRTFRSVYRAATHGPLQFEYANRRPNIRRVRGRRLVPFSRRNRAHGNA